MAERASSAGATGASCGKSTELSRRAILATAGLAAVAATPVAAAAPRWSATNWLSRWTAAGHGARLDGNGHVRLTLRPGGRVTMLAEVNDQRMVLIGDAVRRLAAIEGEDPAVRAAAARAAIDAEWTGADDDAAEVAWTERYRAAVQRLIDVPARTPRGLAAKLRVGVGEHEGGQYGELIEQVIAQLEKMA